MCIRVLYEYPANIILWEVSLISVYDESFYTETLRSGLYDTDCLGMTFGVNQEFITLVQSEGKQEENYLTGRKLLSEFKLRYLYKCPNDSLYNWN